MTFIERLKQARDDGCLTVSDMGVWFGVSRASMNTWLANGKSGGYCPLKNKQKQLEPLLTVLCEVLDSELGIFPVPLGVNQYERKAYIERVKNHAINRLPKAGAPSRGHKVLGDHIQK